MAYATLAELRQMLNQVPVGNANDTMLQVTLDRATAIIDGRLGFSFTAYGATATAKTIRYLGSWGGGEYLVPPPYQAASITGVLLVSGRGLAGETTEAVTEYVAEEDTRPYRLYRDGGWSRASWYRITAKWGYGTAPIAVTQVCLELAVNLWGQRGASQINDIAGVQGSGAVAYTRALTNRQAMILEDVRAQYLGPLHA